MRSAPRVGWPSVVVGVHAGGSLAGNDSQEASSTTSIEGFGVAGLSQPAESRSNIASTPYLGQRAGRGTRFAVYLLKVCNFGAKKRTDGGPRPPPARNVTPSLSATLRIVVNIVT